MNKKIRNSSMFLLWLGAAISIAEIYTGGIIAPLGLKKGLAAILIGHFIGTCLLAFGGWISFVDGKNAMEEVKDTMGSGGAKMVSTLNVLQLLGWSAIMIIQGGRALNAVVPMGYNAALLVMAVMVFLWAYFFNNHSKMVNDFSVLVLVFLCLFIFFKMNKSTYAFSSGDMTFTTAVELSIAMPVSWLPMIGDYAKDGESKRGVAAFSFLGYFIGSVLMYSLGLAITAYTGKDVVEFIAGTGFSAAACLIIVLSTVTTTFMDIYSAVISSKQLFKVKNENNYIVLYSVLATALAFVLPMEQYQNFLMLIGSVFIPVYTVVFTEHVFRVGNRSHSNAIKIAAAAAGTLLYNHLNKAGACLPTVMVIVVISTAYLAISKICKQCKINNS